MAVFSKKLSNNSHNDMRTLEEKSPSNALNHNTLTAQNNDRKMTNSQNLNLKILQKNNSINNLLNSKEKGKTNSSNNNYAKSNPEIYHTNNFFQNKKNHSWDSIPGPTQTKSLGFFFN
jgi:hypothetical protein